ncbi:M3 family oligoendopeptidase [Patescibacteria group bacterium]|nr:M3 family oligoendopeptidase [Patescibacteria group bacterium]
MPKSPSKSLPSWNLSDLFKGTTDPKIDQLIKTQSKKADVFAKTYRGKIAKLTPKRLAEALATYESILQQTCKPEQFAYLLFSADMKHPEHGPLLQKTEKAGLEIFQKLVFLEVELAQMSDAQLKTLERAQALRPYQHFLEEQRINKKHRLSEAEERIMNDKSLTGRSAFVRLFDEELANKAFQFPEGTKMGMKTESGLLDLLHSPKREERKEAAKWFTKGLREELHRLTFVTNTLLQDKQTDDRYRKFPTPEAKRHVDNEITQEMVDAMTAAVTKSYHLVQDFYEFKRRVLGVKTVYDYDRYAPVAESSATYSYDDAQKIVLDAFKKFDPRMAKIAGTFFEKHWIDAKPQLGKRGGAYCMFVTPDLHPYVFMNYTGRLTDVKTLAHELGHAVHASLARKQTFLNFDMPLTVAETASVFGEMLVFDQLRETITDRTEKFALYMEKIESIFATVHRQTSMYLFERDLHAASREQGELSSEAISALWRKRQLEMFGTSVTLTSDYDIWWSYISHFVHTPFYVYSYAFGELLTLALFNVYKERGNSMTKDYIDMLSKGGVVSPAELVKPFGINLSNPTFWEGGIRMIEELIEEAKKLY